MAGFVYRENRVPEYQRLFQKHDGVRFFQKGPRAKAMLYPYYAMLGLSTAASLYMMCRQVLGHKSWFGSK